MVHLNRKAPCQRCRAALRPHPRMQASGPPPPHQPGLPGLSGPAAAAARWRRCQRTGVPQCLLLLAASRQRHLWAQVIRVHISHLLCNLAGRSPQAGGLPTRLQGSSAACARQICPRTLAAWLPAQCTATVSLLSFHLRTTLVHGCQWLLVAPNLLRFHPFHYGHPLQMAQPPANNKCPLRLLLLLSCQYSPAILPVPPLSPPCRWWRTLLPTSPPTSAARMCARGTAPWRPASTSHAKAASCSRWGGWVRGWWCLLEGAAQHHGRKLRCHLQVLLSWRVVRRHCPLPAGLGLLRGGV